MRMKSFLTRIPLLTFLFAPVFLLAQSDIHAEISQWFQEERFIVADQNDDALLDKSEMQAFQEEFCYYLVDRHYQLTDINHDGLLSFHEMLDRSKSEKVYRYNLERKALRGLSSQYPLLAQADARFLKRNPALVADLFSNFVWMAENHKLAEKLVGDSFWMSSHPEASLALHRNLRWMAANPAQAKSLYRDSRATQMLPELLSWRADHQAFIRKHPRLDDFYRQAFFPGGLGLGR